VVPFFERAQNQIKDYRREFPRALQNGLHPFLIQPLIQIIADYIFADYIPICKFNDSTSQFNTKVTK
jgi:hypothetical protein